MGPDSVPLVRSLFHFALANPLVLFLNPLVVFVVGSDIFVPTEIESIGDVVPLVVLYQEESSLKVVDL